MVLLPHRVFVTLVVVGGILHAAELSYVAKPTRSKKMHRGFKPKPGVDGADESVSEIGHERI
jgi:hypothetical protein